jgi:hypothetical protein
LANAAAVFDFCNTIIFSVRATFSNGQKSVKEPKQEKRRRISSHLSSSSVFVCRIKKNKIKRRRSIPCGYCDEFEFRDFEREKTFHVLSFEWLFNIFASRKIKKNKKKKG